MGCLASEVDSAGIGFQGVQDPGGEGGGHVYGCHGRGAETLTGWWCLVELKYGDWKLWAAVFEWAVCERRINILPESIVFS